jgi:RNAse (barnase) inhibitor barstar
MIFCWLTFYNLKSFIKRNREENYKVLQQVKKLKSQKGKNGDAIWNKYQ